MAQTGDIMGNHDTVLRNISLHYTKQSPYFPCSLCTGAPKFPTIFPHKHRPIRLCMRSIPCHTMALHFVSAFYSQLVFFHICTWSPCQPNPASANMPSHCAYIYIHLHIYIYIYIYTYIQSHILLFCRHALFCVLPAKLPLPFAPVTCPAKKVGRRHQGGSPTYNYGL